MAKFKTTNKEGEQIEVDIDLTVDNIPKEVRSEIIKGITAEDLPKETRDTIIKSAQGIAYGNIDTVADKYGIKKEEGEKTSDFIDRVLKANKESLSSLEKELEDARKGVEKPEDVSKLQEEIATHKKIIENQKRDLEEKDKTYRTSILNNKVDLELSGLDIAVPSHITEAEDISQYKQAQQELIKGKLLKSYDIKFEEDGSSYRVLKGNEAELNAKNDIASIRDIAERDFKNWIAKPSENKGQGTGGQGKPSRDSGGGKVPKTIEDVFAMADEAGYKQGSSDWVDYTNEKSAEFGIED